MKYLIIVMIVIIIIMTLLTEICVARSLKNSIKTYFDLKYIAMHIMFMIGLIVNCALVVYCLVRSYLVL